MASPVIEIFGKLERGEPLTDEEIATVEKGTGKKYTGPRASKKPEPKTAKEVTAEADALEARLKRGDAGSDASSGWAELARLRKLAESMSKADAAVKAPKAVEMGKAMASVVPTGGAGPGGGVVPATVAPVAPPVAPPPAPPSPPSPSGPVLQPKLASEAPGEMLKGGQAVGVSEGVGRVAPETSKRFFEYLQKLQGEGNLVAENPMYTKKWDDATAEERARLVTENPNYYKKFLESEGGKVLAPSTAERQAATTALGKDRPEQGAGGAGPGGGEAAPEEGPDWLKMAKDIGVPILGLLQAGAYGQAGIHDLDKLAVTKMLAREDEAKKLKEERDYLERMDAIKRAWESEEAAKGREAESELERWKTDYAASLQREGWTREEAWRAADRALERYGIDASASAAKAAAAASGRSLAEVARAYGE